MAAGSRDRIIQAAADAIAKHGLAAVRMATVAAEAGVSSALLHYHFETRANLFATVLDTSMQRLGLADIDDEQLHQLAPPQRLATMIWSCLPTSPELERDWLLWHELWGQAIRDTEHAATAIKLYRQIDQWLAGAIAEGVAQGDFTAGADPMEIAAVALALCDGLGLRVIFADPVMPLERAYQLVAGEVGRQLGVQLPAPVLSVLPS